MAHISHIDEVKHQIYDKLDQAAETKKTNMLAALAILEEIKKLLPEILAEKNDKASTRNASDNKLQHELQYLQKRANIYYEIEDYDEAMVNYKLIKNHLPNITKLYKAIGDCLRHKGEYDNALKEYNEGIKRIDADEYAEPTDKAEILNSVALVHVQKKDFDAAVKALNEAIGYAQDNPLYVCNLGSALYSKGDKDQAMEQFKKAQELSKADKPAKGLTKQNYEYINKTLGDLFKDIDSMEKVKLKKVDAFTLQRQSRIVSKAIENLTSLKNNKAQQNKEVEQLLSAKEKVAKIQDDLDLNCYYDGFVFTLSQAYLTAVVVSSGQVSRNTSNTTTSVASTLVSWIPFIGSTASSLIKTANDIYQDSRITKASKNVSKFCSTPGQFDDMAQDVVAEVVLKKKDAITKIKPEEYVLPKWLAKFQALLDKIDQAKVQIYGERNEDPFQQLGFKAASSLVAVHIATGKIYGGKVAARITSEEKKKKLIDLVEELIDRDLEHSKKGDAYVPPKEEELTEEPVSASPPSNNAASTSNNESSTKSSLPPATAPDANGQNPKGACCNIF